MDETKAPITLKSLTLAAAHVGRISPELLRGRSREQGVVRIRQALHYLAHVRLGRSLSEVGNGTNRDHTTVLHSIRSVRQALERMPTITGPMLDNIWTVAEDFADRLARRDRLPVTVVAVPDVAEPAPAAKPQAVAAAVPPKRPPVVANPRLYVPFSPEWWRANDLAFREGLVRAYGRGVAA